MAEIAPTAEDLADLAAYDALMWALSRPGEVRVLPEPGMGSIIAALLDRECRVHVQEPELMPAVLNTGAIIAELGEADHVLMGRAFAPAMLADLAMGSDLYPDEGASVFLPARIGQGQALRLSGPGIEGSVECRIDLPPETWTIRARAMRYPMGFELFLVDGDRVLALPRSTSIEVL